MFANDLLRQLHHTLFRLLHELPLRQGFARRFFQVFPEFKVGGIGRQMIWDAVWKHEVILPMSHRDAFISRYPYMYRSSLRLYTATAPAPLVVAPASHAAPLTCTARGTACWSTTSGTVCSSTTCVVYGANRTDSAYSGHISAQSSHASDCPDASIISQ